MQVGVFRPDVPGVVRRPANVGRRGVAFDAKIECVEEWNDARRSSAGRQTRRQCQVGRPDTLVEGLSSRAVEMRALVPIEVEVDLAGLRRTQVVALIVIADVLAAEVDTVDAVAGSRGQPDIRERTRPEIAIFIELGQVLPILIGRAVAHLVAIALRIVEETAIADLHVTVEPPQRWGLTRRRSLQWYVGRLSLHAGHRPCHTAQQCADHVCLDQSDPFHLPRPLTKLSH